MSIYKSEHTSSSGSWIRRLLSRLLREKCDSHITLDITLVGKRHTCCLPKGHKYKHENADRSLKWAYGDEYFNFK